MDLYYDPTPLIPGLICAMFATYLYPRTIGKTKSLNQKAIGASIVAGIMSFLCYTFMAIYDVFLLEISFVDRILQTIAFAIASMIGAMLFTRILFYTDEESDS